MTNVIYIVPSCTLMSMMESSKLLSITLPLHVLLEKKFENGIQGLTDIELVVFKGILQV